MKKVLVIGTGGTISTIAEDPLDTIDYPENGLRLSVVQLFQKLSIRPKAIELVFFDLATVSSTQIGPEFWWSLRSHILKTIKYSDDIVGIVVTHGTGTMEETAFAMHLLLDIKVPVVLTGAQRPANALSSDAAQNLWSALSVASHKHAQNRGTLVVINNEIHCSKSVSKVSNFSLDAFKTIGSKPLGFIHGRDVIFTQEVEQQTVFDWVNLDDWPRVDIVYSYAGADEAHIDASVEAGAKGIVIAGLAPGYATPAQRHSLARARRSGVQIAMSSRAIFGRTVSLKQNQVPNLIGTRGLTPQKARILLSIALMNGLSEEELDDLFAKF